MVADIKHTRTEWAPPPQDVTIQEGEVHVWRVSMEAEKETVDRLRGFLSEEERARANRFLRPEHRRRFAIAHGALRIILARYLRIDPRVIELETGEFGKPFLSGTSADSRIDFNLSHSGELALVAVARGRSVGVDLEAYRRRLEADKIARRYFSPNEVERLFQLSEEEREGAFYACWSRKEAYMKADGKGLSLGLNRFDVAFAPGEAPALLRSEVGAGELERWTFHVLDVAPRYAAACVVEGKVEALRCWCADEMIGAL